MAVELYHFWSSVCSVRARHALEEKGVAWTSRYIDLFKFDQMQDRKSTRLNSSHIQKSRMPSSA